MGCVTTVKLTNGIIGKQPIEKNEVLFEEYCDIYYDDNNIIRKEYTKKELKEIINKMDESDSFYTKVYSDGTN